MCVESGLPDDLSWGRLGYIRWLDTAQDLCHSKATHPLDHTDFTDWMRLREGETLLAEWSKTAQKQSRLRSRSPREPPRTTRPAPASQRAPLTNSARLKRL